MSSPTPMVPAATNQGNGEFTAQAPLQIPRTLQSTDLVNSLAFYEVTFITSTTGVIDRIQMAFPPGTGVGAAGVIERVGIGGGTLLKSGSIITYDVTTPVSIPAGTFIRLEMFGIKNPVNPSNPSTPFAGVITTLDSGMNAIDGPSFTNIYTIKKIVSSDLADGAVTGPKIAGTSKLIFGTCSGTIPILAPGASAAIFCSDANSQFLDEVVGEWCNTRSGLAPVHMTTTAENGQVVFAFENLRSSTSNVQNNVILCYTIFNKS